MARRKPGVNEDLLLNKVVLRPERRHARTPESLGRPFEPFQTAAPPAGHLISGWYFPAVHPVALALVNPSNSGTGADALDHVSILAECGCSVLLYDYQGFGDSGGLADVRTLAGDAECVLEWARHRSLLRSGEQRPSLPLLVVGLSLGSLVAIHLASAGRHCVAGLILDGAVEPFRALRRSFGPLGAAIAEVACAQVPPFLDSQRQVTGVTCPVLYVHGWQDTIGTIEDAQYLAGRTPHATLWVLDDCSHLDIARKHPVEYVRQVRQFLARAIVR